MARGKGDEGKMNEMKDEGELKAEVERGER